MSLNIHSFIHSFIHSRVKVLSDKFLIFPVLILFCLKKKHDKKEGNVVVNATLNTFYLPLYGVGHMVDDYSERERERERDPANTHTHTRLAARVLLYEQSHIQDSTYHSLCYICRGTLAETRNRSMGSCHDGPMRQPIAP